MNQNKISSKARQIIKSAFVAAVLPILFIYIMIAKPDYKIMNGLAHIIVPVATWVGDIITWPIRATGDVADNIKELANLRHENEELRFRLDDALRNKNICDIAIAENTKLTKELDIVQKIPQDTIIADVIQDNSAFYHNTFFINRGSTSGMANGMVVLSMDGRFAGIIIDTASNFSRVRAITDADTNIAVRIAGSDTYGFLQGHGTSMPTIGFFNSHEFTPQRGMRLVTSNISGVLPSNIFVGIMENETDVQVLSPKNLSRVMVLKYDTKKEYK